jgi:hypothetical protein
MRGLAFRRHQWWRARQRAYRCLRWLWASDPGWVTARVVARRAVDRTPCSCFLCGNPRRFTGEVTRQEALAECRCEGAAR